MAVWWGSPVKDLPEMGEVGWERRGMGRGMEGGGQRRGSMQRQIGLSPQVCFICV